ncbi:MAG TPA: NUDIX domain-containing protein [Armatimonadota bacterium]|nr:NUDIX domain-containing protein [Armatimonadota bacterium]
MADIHKIGLFTRRGARVLLCRKRTLAALILPGGRLEAGESAMACLGRELREELGDVTLANARYLGTYEDRAASADPAIVQTVEIQLYGGELRGDPVAAAEIAELVWFGPDDDGSRLSPILVNHIFPDLIQRGLLPWRQP